MTARNFTSVNTGDIGKASDINGLQTGVTALSVITTEGDLTQGGTSGVEERLAIGAAGTYLGRTAQKAGWHSAITLAEQAAPATPASGYAVIYPDTSGRYAAKDDAGDIWDLGRFQVRKKTADQTLTAAQTTLTAVTDLQFTLRANTDYFFEYFLVHQSVAATTGLAIAVLITTATVTYLVYRTEIHVTNVANGTDNVQTEEEVASGGTHTAASQAAAATNSLAIVRGVISVGATGGTIDLQFAGDALANITAKKGSYGRLWV